MPSARGIEPIVESQAKLFHQLQHGQVVAVDELASKLNQATAQRFRVGPHAAAHAVARFVHHDVHAGFLEPMGAMQPRHAGSDHNHLVASANRTTRQRTRARDQPQLYELATRQPDPFRPRKIASKLRQASHRCGASHKSSCAGRG